MKKLLIYLLLINVAFANLTNEEKEYIKNNTITINITTSWIPFHYKNKDEKTIGIALDFWKLIADKTKIKYKIIEAKNFTEVLDNIKNKKYDLNIATTKTIDNEKYSLFTKNYERYPIAIATKGNERFIDGTASLINKKVAVGKNYSAYFILSKKYPKINFVFTKDVEEALKLVDKGKVFAAVDIEPSLYFQIAKNNLNTLKVTRSDVYFDLLMITNQNNAILQSILNKTIDLITKDEKIRIYKKWVNERDYEKIDYELITQITILFLVILFIITIAYIKNRELNNKIATLNKNLEKKVDEEIKKNEHQQLLLLRQSRLAQMGEMISMIAHQWRQPLNNLSIINQTLILKYKRKNITDKDIANFSTNSNQQIQNMSKVIDDFKNFFKPEKQKSIFDLNVVIDSALDMLKPIFDKLQINIIFEKNNNTSILGYSNEFRQAIINILTNAKDEFENINLSQKNIFIKIKKENPFIILSIEDNANGIKEDVINKIFDPYFSTKSEKNGTGIGLYMTKIIIEDHMNGEIQASNKNDGAVFTIKLKMENE